MIAIAPILARLLASRVAAGLATRAGASAGTSGSIGEIVGGLMSSRAANRNDDDKKRPPRDPDDKPGMIDRIREMFGRRKPAADQRSGAPPVQPTWGQYARTPQGMTAMMAASAKGENPQQSLMPQFKQWQQEEGKKSAADAEEQKHGAAGVLVDKVKGFGSSAAAGPAGVIAGFAGLVIASKKLGDTIVEAQQRLTKYNGTIAVAYALAERGQVFRDIESGGRTEDATKSLIEAQEEMLDETQVYRDILTNIYSYIGMFGYKVITFVAAMGKWMPLLGSWIQHIEENTKKDKKMTPGLAYLKAIADTSHDNSKPEPQIRR